MKPAGTFAWIIVGALVFALTTCIKTVETSPKQELTPTPQVVTTRLTALIIGHLSYPDGCLRVNGYLLVLPPEFTASIEGETVRVQDGLTGDKAVWHLGQEVSLGGGEVQYQNLTEAVQQRVPAHCKGPYWLVGDIVPQQVITTALP